MTSHDYDGDPDYDDDRDYDDEGHNPRVFANPGSALRCATASNPRDMPCPTCKAPNRLTREDVFLGYQCDRCADLAERGGY